GSMESVRVGPRFELRDGPGELRIPRTATEPDVSSIARLEPEHDAKRTGRAQPGHDDIPLNVSTAGHGPGDAVFGCLDAEARRIQPVLRADAVDNGANPRHLAEIDDERLPIIGE